MLPEKSVTAIMGVSEVNTHCRMEGCEACANTTCAYRRNTIEGYRLKKDIDRKNF